MQENFEEERQIIGGILSFYEIGKFVRFIKRIKPFEEYRNSVLSFETSQGKFVLKEIKRGNIEKKMKKINLMAHLIKTNFGIKSSLVLNKKLNGYTIFDGRMFVIEKFLDGNILIDKGGYSDDRLINAARHLADLHKFVPEEFSRVDIEKTFTNFNMINKIFESSTEDLSFIEKINSFSEKSDFDYKVLNEIIPFYREQFEKLKSGVEIMRKRGEFKNKKACIIHGDFHPQNLIFNGVEVAGLIDFETMALDFHGYELIKGMSLFTHLKGDGFRLDRVKLFLDSYKEVFGEFNFNPNEVMVYLRHAILHIGAIMIMNYSARPLLEKREEYFPKSILNFFYEKLVDFVKHEKEIMNLLSN